ncbi:MAG: tyrosine-type recombinase/integrase [Bacillota bacterium]
MEEYIKKFLFFKNDLSNSSKKSYKRYLKKLSTYLEEKNLSNIQKIDKLTLLSFIDDLENKDLKSNTINKYISIINSFFKFLNENDYIDRKIELKRLRVQKKDKNKDIIYENDLRRFLKKLNNDKITNRNALIIMFLYFTPLKLKEILSIKIDDFHNDFEFLNINSYQISLNKDIVKKLKNYDNKYKIEKYMFINYKGKKLSRQYVWKFLKEYSKEYKIKLSPSKLNRSYKINKLLKSYKK